MSSKDAYYFSHDSNAFHDPKIIRLRAEFGLEGYGFYWAVIEMLRNQADYCLHDDDLELLSFHLQFDPSKTKQMLSKCLAIGLLEKDECKVFSQSLLIRMEKADAIRNKRREAGALGGKAKASAKQNPSKPVALKESKLNKKEILERKKEFKELTKNKWAELGSEKYLSQKEAINFFDYWTEHGDNDLLMRFEKEKSFGVGRRLGTWKKNNSKPTNPNVRQGGRI